jgi:uncharacterized glyoxalase superfamily protein PhnB
VLSNRSIPRSTVIPEVSYPDVASAAAWLCEAFGFTVRLRIADHRIQLNVGEGAVVVTERQAGASGQPGDFGRVLVRVEDAQRHHDHATQHGAQILRPPSDYPFGERQYTARDPGGHVWTFSQSIADAEPESWGGESVELWG